ncbi:MAG: hypothetical protein WCK02_14135 [Bacteroidota bacterium]
MGFEDFFEDDHKHKHGYNQQYRHDDYYRSSHHSNGHYEDKKQLIIKLINNPKLRIIPIIAVIAIILILILIISLIFPILLKLFNLFMENGLQGVIDLIWKGSK